MWDLSHLFAEIAYKMGAPASFAGFFRVEDLEESFLLTWTGQESLRGQAMHWARCVFEADKWQCSEGMGQLYVLKRCDYALDRLSMTPRKSR